MRMFQCKIKTSVMLDQTHQDSERQMAKTAISGVFIAPASIIGASFGQYLFKRVPVTWFKTFAHGLLVVIGISMLVI